MSQSNIQTVLELISDNPIITLNEIAEKTGKSLSTVKRHIAHLKKDRKDRTGDIRRILESNKQGTMKSKGIPGWIRRLAPVLVAVCLTSCIKDRIPQGADLEAGDRLPEFSVTMDDGSTISTADMLGGISCIVFFHTGCPDCQKTLPLIQQLYDRYESAEFRFLCISREEGAAEIAEYWTEHGYTMPYSAQESREIYNLFATYAVPRIYISDIDGVIRSIWTDNPLPTFDELETALLDAMPQARHPY